MPDRSRLQKALSRQLNANAKICMAWSSVAAIGCAAMVIWSLVDQIDPWTPVLGVAVFVAAAGVAFIVMKLTRPRA
ncbi:hypothetical protein [Brevundimonas sp.]|jgi:hypothetical protein|uniref:hypothetical protein n=1 Tax=Brevundimonas sp. TaxID=1871086 RepID=UPI0037C06AAA